MLESKLFKDFVSKDSDLVESTKGFMDIYIEINEKVGKYEKPYCGRV